MKCPHCDQEIPNKAILKYRQTELAKRKRKPNNNNPYGRKGKPKEESK